MFNQLIESKRSKKRSPGTAAFSIGLHAGLIGLAVWATANAAIKNEKPKAEKIEFVQVKKDEPPPPKKEAPPPPKATVAPPPPKGFQVPQAPPIVPVKIPDIDLSKKVTNVADFSGKGVEGGVANGVVGGKGPVSNTETYFSFQVEKPAAMASGTVTPQYPETLRSAGIEGEVDAEFTVDTTGRVDQAAGIKINKATNDLFAAAVKSALPRMKFYPAEIGGHKVRQLVQQPFTFTITH
jgi:protein TonB